MSNKTMPWETGNTGWENYSDFQSWLALKMGPNHIEWVNDSPSALMTVFYQFGNDSAAEAKLEAIRAALERCLSEYDSSQDAYWQFGIEVKPILEG